MNKYKLLKSFNLWFTGLPSSGKTTTGSAFREVLSESGISSVLLDGDIVRTGLSADLKFSQKDREENNRRIIHVSDIVVRNDIPAITTFISPYKETRAYARKIIPGFIEVFVDTPIEECIRRDVKGLYAKAKKGEITGMTGVDDPYEVPTDAEITLKTIEHSLEENIQQIVKYLVEKKYLAIIN